MDPTTLVTFLFDCPGAVARTVELLGSWDNFSKPYPLKLDRRRSPSTWSGCYTFDDIICDGDLANLGDRRSGALMMGGTYWYYYKVNNDEEYHNPSEPSTTVCPLLPGQRLNMLEVPVESIRKGNVDGFDTFTRNPNDKYLNPVPSNPLPSPRLGDLCKEAYKVSMQPLRSPRSATYPPPPRSISPSFKRQARSASTSSDPSGTGLFTDFRMLKEKLASSARSASSTRVRSKEWRKELKIGAPMLVSSTAEDINLVPLRSARTPKTSSSRITDNLRAYSPLRSNPVDPIRDFDFDFESSQSTEGDQVQRRPSSHMEPMTTTLDSSSQSGRARANSSETRRTRHYFHSNEPWISSPKLHRTTSWNQISEEDSRAANIVHGAETLWVNDTSSLQAPVAHIERPTSRHGGDENAGLRKSPLEKELPALPRYLVPAPLFACHGSTSSMLLEDTDEDVDEDDNLDAHVPEHHEFKSHFSVWSTASTTFSMPTSEEDALHSTTYSSLSSNTSMPCSPQRWNTETSVAHGNGSSLIGSTLPKLRSFGPSLFQLDIQYSDTVPRRQAACYGLAGFQGYGLPEVDTTSQSTITKTASPTPINSQGGATSVSQLEKLMSDFGYLGDSVV